MSRVARPWAYISTTIFSRAGEAFLTNRESWLAKSSREISVRVNYANLKNMELFVG
jgi:hypothetical protein